jgi:hypothetical protein
MTLPQNIFGLKHARAGGGLKKQKSVDVYFMFWLFNAKIHL